MTGFPGHPLNRAFMLLTFPDSFVFGTSTSAYQIETAYDHDWEGVVARDGAIFRRTTDHELRVDGDVEIIASLAPSYRLSLMWSKLQRGPYTAFDQDAVESYHHLLRSLKARGIKIMMVMHHWCHPRWFVKRGGWESKEGQSMFFDFARRLVDEFGSMVTWWNTFNEPNLYATFSYAIGEFPPYARDIFRTMNVARNMSAAHEQICDYIRQKLPDALCGISHNCVSFAADNFAGVIPSRIADYWYMEYLPSLFSSSDFIGLSYYARLAFDPFPVSYLQSPEKFVNGRPHDDIWEYYPEGLGEAVMRYANRFGKPIIITENGVCTQDDAVRVKALKDYMLIIHSMLAQGVDIRGYFHWSTWDNFEWTLGPSYQFGLYACDPVTGDRKKKNSADIYSKLSYERRITI